KAKTAVAIPCYADREYDLARLIDEEMRTAGLSIASDARAVLLSLLGGDRLASRSEIQKLTLYAEGKRHIELNDVLAVVTDAAILANDAVVDAAFAGRTQDVEAQFAKAIEAGTTPGTIAGATLRQVMQLHRARLAIESGTAMDDALSDFRPPVHFSRKP